MNSISTLNETITTFVLVLDFLMYFYLQPAAFIVYLLFLIAIYKSSSQDIQNKRIIRLNKILWWVSFGPFATLFWLYFLLTFLKEYHYQAPKSV